MEFGIRPANEGAGRCEPTGRCAVVRQLAAEAESTVVSGPDPLAQEK